MRGKRIEMALKGGKRMTAAAVAVGVPAYDSSYIKEAYRSARIA